MNGERSMGDTGLSRIREKGMSDVGSRGEGKGYARREGGDRGQGIGRTGQGKYTVQSITLSQ
jgi:hypothetical protein